MDLLFMSIRKSFSVSRDNTIAVIDRFRDTVLATDSTAEIGKACAVYFLPTNEQMSRLRDKVGEENFYIIADDYAWYQAQAYASSRKKD